eukprot:CAMPEP_0113548630 /NCGR_PEP_ID=MMETSP0015_2-20120614/12995_1 /TAXON_ID=2838 /ORGANISM="Odontella" /LENGTH=179 /DNA_ID=CAMNT_0000449271 /DNA_START=365 /DNA_END=902 /DNA_ORIENTATION=- /assembly_acc=CAM_ASM_000160
MIKTKEEGASRAPDPEQEGGEGDATNGGAPQDPQPRGTDGNCGEKTADDRGEDEEGVDPPRVREAHGGEERASEEEAKALEEAGKAGEKDVTQTLKAKEQGGGRRRTPPTLRVKERVMEEGSDLQDFVSVQDDFKLMEVCGDDLHRNDRTVSLRSSRLRIPIVSVTGYRIFPRTLESGE